MKSGDNKRVKKGMGGVGSQLPVAAGANGVMSEGKGQELVVAGGGLARGAGRRVLTALEFQGLAAVPLEAEWFANIVTRSHVLTWRKDLEGRELGGALFRPVKNNTGGTVEGAMTADGIYKMVKHYAKRVGVNIEGFGAHSLRAMAATNALDHEADIATMRLYDRRKTRPEDSPTFKVRY
jgi:integrase